MAEAMSPKLSPENPSGSPSFAPTDLIISAGLLVLAFGLYAAGHRDLQSVAGQFHKYPEAALRLLQGALDTERLLDYSPVYLGLCALIARSLDGNFQVLFWIQIFLVALTAAGLFLVLRRHFGRIISLCGTSAFLLYPGVMIYSGVFEPEPVMMASVVMLVLSAGSRSPAGSFATGVALMVCVLTRPTFFLLAPLIPVHMWMTLEGRRRATAIALFLLPVIAGVSFVGSRIGSSAGSFPPPLMNPGTQFFSGNNPLVGGTTLEHPPLVIELAGEFPAEVDYDHASYRLLARRGSTVSLNQAEINRYWASLAVNFIRDEPAHFLGLLVNKVLYLFHGHRWHDLPESFRADRTLTGRGLPFVPLSLISAFCICGLIAGLSRWRDYFIYYIAFLSMAGVMLLTYSTSERQRLSLIPFFILFGVVGCDRLLGAEWGRRRSLLALLALAPLVALFSIDNDLTRDNRRNWENFGSQTRLQGEAFGLRDALKFPEATKALAQSYAAAPWMEPFGIRPAGLPVPAAGLAGMALREFPTVRGDDPTARFDRAILMIEAGDLDGAERLLTVLRREGRSFNRIINRPSRPAYYLGRIAALRGRRSEAAKLMSEALVQSPGDPAILAQLSALTGETRYSVTLSRYFGELSALGFLATASLENGQAERAAALFRRLIEKLPEYRKGEILLAAALADAGRDEEAVAAYLDAMRKRSEPVMGTERIIAAFGRLAEGRSADDIARYRYAVALRQGGYYLEARRVLRRSTAAAGSPLVRQELDVLEETIRRAGLK